MQQAFQISTKLTLKAPLKVSELISQVKNDVEKKHRNIRVIGEISSFKQWRSGHCYFDIKDEHALIPAVMFRHQFERIKFEITDGQEVLIIGSLSIYAPNSKLQIIAESMEPVGQGALALAFEQLKTKLTQEGLFEKKHKKILKIFNQTIGIITSSHGAVLRDMARIIKTRSPKTNILLFPVRVQGPGAKEEITQAIKLLDYINYCDVIIMGRGGGSMEDLWAFNEECVARAIFAAKTPIVSAVGHETDFTICDFVADLRAATPTHAAQLVSIDEQEYYEKFIKTKQELKNKITNLIKSKKIILFEQKKLLKDPRILLFKHWQELDYVRKNLLDLNNNIFSEQKNKLNILKQKLAQLAPMRLIRIRREKLNYLKNKLISCDPGNKIINNKIILDNKKNILQDMMKKNMLFKRKIFENKIIKLETLSPLKILQRGYNILEDQESKIITSIHNININSYVKIKLSDGQAEAKITQKELKDAGK